MGWTRPLVWLLAALVVLGGLPLGTAAAVGATDQLQTEQSASNTTEVTAGQQLSTVLAVTSDDVQTEVEATGFELEFERSDDTARAEALAQRGERLRERAEDIREDYADATEAYEEGELSESAYAQRIATLNARANNVAAGYEQFESRTSTVSETELRAAGVNETAVRAAVDDVDSVRGVGADALLQRFTGTSTGEFEIRTADGVSVEVEGEDGERSREIRRPRDGDLGFDVSQSTALNTSLAALSTPPANASWGLEEASVHEDSGYYEFEFAFATANRTGEAGVRVDGSSGEVFRLEEGTELTDAAEERRESEREDEEEEREAEDEREDDEREDDASTVTAEITVSDGTATVTVTDDGRGVGGATVLANDRQAGATDANGTLSFELPDDDDVDVEVRDGEFEAEFEFERRNGTFVQTDGPEGTFEEPESDEETEEAEAEAELADSETEEAETEADEEEAEAETETEEEEAEAETDEEETETDEEETETEEAEAETETDEAETVEADD